MSYCRWSSMDWQCDVYVYEDAHGGWTTHVAERRKVGVPKNNEELFSEAWLEMHQKQMEVMDALPWLDLSTIGDEAGESYNDSTPGECADRLCALREKGFNVPENAIAALREESE